MVKNKDKRFTEDDIERWKDILINVGFEEIKESDLNGQYKVYSERTLDTRQVKLPDWMAEYYYLVTKVVFPKDLSVVPIVGYYRGYYFIFKVEDNSDFPLFEGSKFFIKLFDPFKEFDGVMTGKVTTHNTTHKGVTTVRSRIAFTGKEIAEIGLEQGQEFNILFKQKRGGHPGFLIFQHEDD